MILMTMATKLVEDDDDDDDVVVVGWAKVHLLIRPSLGGVRLLFMKSSNSG